MKTQNQLLILLTCLAGISILINISCVFLTVLTLIITIFFHVIDGVLLLGVASRIIVCERKKCIWVLFLLNAFLCCSSLWMIGSLFVNIMDVW